MGRIAPGQQFTGQEKRVAGFPISQIFLPHSLQIHPTCRRRGVPGYRRPVFQTRRRKRGRARPIQSEMDMACGGTVGDQGHGQGCRMGGIVEDLDIEYRRHSAQSLGADAQSIDLVIQFDAKDLHRVGGAPCLEQAHVDGRHEGLLGQEHGLLGSSANADPQHPRRAPPGAQGGDGGQNPIHQ